MRTPWGRGQGGTGARLAAPGPISRALRALLLGAAMAAAGGCTTLTNYFSDADTAEPPAELVDLEQTLTVQEVWRRNVGEGVDEQYLKLRPVIAEGRLFAAGRDGEVSAYDAASGERLWTVNTGEEISGGPGIGPGLVLLGTGNGEVLALEADTGERRWASRVSSEVLAPPVAGSAAVAARTGDGKIYGLSLESGERRWVYDRAVPALSLRGTSTPAVYRDLLVAGLDSGRLVAIEMDRGLTVWELRVTEPRGRSELERLVDIDADPLIRDGIVYVVSYQGRVAAIDLNSGEFLWRRDMSSHAGLTVDDRNVYVTDERSHVWALDRNNSGSLWRQQDLQARALTAPAVVGGYLAVADFEGYVHWMRTEDGRLVARTQVGDGVIAAPLAYSGRVYVYDRGGTVTVFEVN